MSDERPEPRTLGDVVRALRAREGLTQAQLAAASGLSASTIQAYEQGKRLPGPHEIERLRGPLEATPQDQDDLRRGAGLGTLPDKFEASLLKGRGAPETVWDEVQDTPWTCMVINERRELVAWNRLANRTGERDLGTLSQFQRSVLRMAATAHYGRHLTNWDDLIGRLIALFKFEGSNLSDGTEAQYIQSVLADIGGSEDAGFLERIFGLFVTAPDWRNEARNVHPIRWRLDDGTELSFHGAFGDWSNYDGMWAFDWQPADAPTAAWVESEFAKPGGESQRPEVLPFAEYIAAERAVARLSRSAVAERSGLSEASIVAYERRTRSPSRNAILALCRALTIDGYATNRFLREAGFEEEPADFARWISGETPISLYRGRMGLESTPTERIFAESEALAWPCAVLDAGCHVVYANASARRLIGFERWRALPGRPGPHLVQLMVSDPFLEQARNWEEVAGVVLPGRLEPQVLGAPQQASQSALRAVSEHVRHTNPRGLARLADVWHNSPGFSSLRRPGVRFEWTTEDGAELTFNCTISGWNAFDPYKSLDLFPATPETFAWLANADSDRTDPTA